MKNIIIKFCRDSNIVGLPFIQVEVKNKGYVTFMIDTGSNDNVLFEYAVKQLGDTIQVTEDTNSLFGINGDNQELHYGIGTFSFEKKEYSIKFLLSKGDTGLEFSEELGFPVCGVIGTKFMTKHGWIIDYSRQEVRITKP